MGFWEFWGLALVLSLVGQRLYRELRDVPHDPAARFLTRPFGVRPSSPTGRWSRRDRLRAALASLGLALGCGALGALAIIRSDRWPPGSPLQRAAGVVIVVTGIGTVFALAGAILHLIAAPFERSEGTRPWPPKE